MSPAENIKSNQEPLALETYELPTHRQGVVKQQTIGKYYRQIESNLKVFVIFAGDNESSVAEWSGRVTWMQFRVLPVQTLFLRFFNRLIKSTKMQYSQNPSKTNLSTSHLSYNRSCISNDLTMPNFPTSSEAGSKTYPQMRLIDKQAAQFTAILRTYRRTCHADSSTYFVIRSNFMRKMTDVKFCHNSRI